VFEVFGGRRVLLDNFGASIGRGSFENALGILLSPHEEAVAAFCRQTRVRWIVIEDPAPGMASQVAAMGLPVERYVPGGSAPRAPARFSFWWRAFADRGAAISSGARQSPAFRSFRLVYTDATGALQVWELPPS
jgi:hypothetical protein